VGGKPTIRFSGVNVQVVSGAGKTNAVVNGMGNLVIGYDENEGKHEQTGSHNLILGEEQTFTSFGGIVAGVSNSITGESASVIGGTGNTASEAMFEASVSGGRHNHADGNFSSILGGKATDRDQRIRSYPIGISSAARLLRSGRCSYSRAASASRTFPRIRALLGLGRALDAAAHAHPSA
jgi:hypothetical protein